MPPAYFTVTRHTLPTSYIREYARATADDQEVNLSLAVKQYTPIAKPQRDARAVTIIGAHANGFPKELYEPLWDELHDTLKAKNIHIRGIWIADVAHQGQSSVLNEKQLGDDPSWYDHPRDLFLMINKFRSQMKRPIIGIGHSMGGNHLVNLSYMHPRLFTTLILMDPVFQRSQAGHGPFILAKLSSQRRDRWPSRNAARTAFEKSKFYQQWDPRVLDNWIEYGLRDLPTLIYPKANVSSNTLPVVSADPSTASVQPDKNDEVEVTLTTTKHQEVFTFSRPIFKTVDYPMPSVSPNPRTHPDVNPEVGNGAPFYRAEGLETFAKLPTLRPSVLYVFADQSPISAPLFKAEKMAATGSGVGGSGGVRAGRVKEVTLKGVGHLIPMEAVRESAEHCASWINPELERWAEWEELDRQEWAHVPKGEKSQMSKEFQRMIRSNDWRKEGYDEETFAKARKARL